MKLPRIPVTTRLSMILLIAVIVFWIRSRHHADILGVYTPAGNLQAMVADRNGLLFAITDIPFGVEKGFSADAMSMAVDDFVPTHEYIFDPTKKNLSILGFRFADGMVLNWGWKFHAFLSPYWALAAAFAVLPGKLLRRIWLRWRWSRNGRCGECGYDLRHSAGRCPECGAPIHGKHAVPDQLGAAPR